MRTAYRETGRLPAPSSLWDQQVFEHIRAEVDGEAQPSFTGKECASALFDDGATSEIVRGHAKDEKRPAGPVDIAAICAASDDVVVAASLWGRR